MSSPGKLFRAARFLSPPPIIFTTPNFLDTCLLKLFSIGCGLCFGIVQFCLKLFLLFKKRKQISKIFYWIFHINKKKILHNFSFFILIPVFFKFVGCLGIGVFNWHLWDFWTAWFGALKYFGNFEVQNHNLKGMQSELFIGKFTPWTWKISIQFGFSPTIAICWPVFSEYFWIQNLKRISDAHNLFRTELIFISKLPFVLKPKPWTSVLWPFLGTAQTLCFELDHSQNSLGPRAFGLDLWIWTLDLFCAFSVGALSIVAYPVWPKFSNSHSTKSWSMIIFGHLCLQLLQRACSSHLKTLSLTSSQRNIVLCPQNNWSEILCDPEWLQVSFLTISGVCWFPLSSLWRFCRWMFGPGMKPCLLHPESPSNGPSGHPGEEHFRQPGKVWKKQTG